MKHVVIIGTGLAGYTVAKEFRKLNPSDRLTIITKDDGCFYSKPLLSTSLAQQKTPDQLCVNDADKMSKQLSAAIHTHWVVEKIDASEKQLICHDEQGEAQVVSYDQLVLANGARKVHAPLTGDAVDHVLSVNDLEDYRQFRDALSDKKHIAVLGSGLVGCEFANDLLATGHQVTIIAPDDYPLMQLVPKPVGESLQAAFEEKGVQWHLGCLAESVNFLDGAYQITLSDGKTVEADLVLSAVGIRPDVRLAESAGLSVNQGIVTNAQLQTNDPNIYAIGDCAQVMGDVKMYIAPILQGAKILAQALEGGDAVLTYPVMPVVIKTTCCPIALVLPRSHEGQWEYERVDQSVKALFKDPQGRLQGFALSGMLVKDRMNLVKEMDAI